MLNSNNSRNINNRTIPLSGNSDIIQCHLRHKTLCCTRNVSDYWWRCCWNGKLPVLARRGHKVEFVG